jgi:hypothetical protein
VPFAERLVGDAEAGCHFDGASCTGFDKLHRRQAPGGDVAGLPAPCRHAPEEHCTALVVLYEVDAVVQLDGAGRHERERASFAHGANPSTPEHLSYSHITILPRAQAPVVDFPFYFNENSLLCWESWIHESSISDF